MIDYHDRPTPTRITPWQTNRKLPKTKYVDPYKYHPDMVNKNKITKGKPTIYVITNNDGSKEKIAGLETLANYFGRPTIGSVRSMLRLKSYRLWGIESIEVENG